MREKLKDLMNRIHSDEKGGVSLETILIIAAIALPILIFLITIAWPSIQSFFDQGMQELREGSTDVYDDNY